MYDELKCITIEKPYIGWSNISGIPVTLDVLYADGWWITEIFGNYAAIVRKSPSFDGNCPRFRLLYKKIDLSNASKKALRIIERVKQKKWDAYKKYMLVGVSY